MKVRHLAIITYYQTEHQFIGVKKKKKRKKKEKVDKCLFNE